MTYTKTPTLTQSVLAAALMFGVTLSAGYSVGMAYVGFAGDNIYDASLLQDRVAARRAAASSSVSSKKVIRLGKKKIVIAKPRTRTNTGSSAAVVRSSAPNVPIKASCGDSLLIKNLGEECDDGNTDNGDGCSSNCKIESGFSCAGTPTLCYSYCGDSITTPAEQCDDGNNTGGDGCSAVCKKEFGYSCSGSPSFCEITPYCGDGIKASTEQCDDGNVASGDGCFECKIQ